MTLARCKVTIEAQTNEGELVVIDIARDWTSEDALFPPLGMDPMTWVIGEAAKRARAALDVGKPKGATFGDAKRLRDPQVSCERSPRSGDVPCARCGAMANAPCHEVSRKHEAAAEPPTFGSAK